MSGPCAKQRVIAEIVTPAGERIFGENLCAKPQKTCPRADLPTGVGYHLCREVCGHGRNCRNPYQRGESMSGDAFDYDAMLAAARKMRPKLIGFCGPAGAGKSYAANILAQTYGYSRVRFAGPLKAMMRSLGLSEDEVDGALKEAPCALLGGQTPRRAMQTLGTEWGRELIGHDIWINAWGRAAGQYLDKGLPVVVDDVRFANEASAIWKRGGVIVRLARAGAGSVIGADHASETQKFPFDERLTNIGDPDVFRALLDGLLHEI